MKQSSSLFHKNLMRLLPDTQNCGLRMRRECRECFPRHRFQRKPLISDPGMHHGMCVKHVPWCMSGSLTNGGGGNVPGIPGACAARNFAYLVRGPWNPLAKGHFFYVGGTSSACLHSDCSLLGWRRKRNQRDRHTLHLSRFCSAWEMMNSYTIYPPITNQISVV